MEMKDMAKDLDANAGVKGLEVGDDLYYAPLVAGGRPFHFKPDQRKFVYLLLKSRDLKTVCAEVGWSEEKAQRFFRCRKWLEYKELLKVREFVDKGRIKSEWWEFIVDGMRGYKERWMGVCELCHEEYVLPPSIAEQYRDDNMQMVFECRMCKSPVKLEHLKEEFRPSREQVQCAAEAGARVEPKVERKINEFSTDTIAFMEAEVA
jgi:hypothetical protein